MRVPPPTPPTRSTRPTPALLAAAVMAVLLASCAGTDRAGDSTSETTTGPPTSTPSPDQPEADPAGVSLVEVTDGDTIVVRIDGVEERVRLIGINTPESGECLADAAGDRLTDLLSGGSITLVGDRTDRDQYDRLLRYVEVDGTDIHESLVAEGLALSRRYEPDTARADRYDAAQAVAEEASVGQWAADACGPASAASVTIVEVNADAPGDDGQNLNEEWVVIRNDGPEPLDLTGWGLKDESASNRFTFPAGLVLPSGATVTVRSGCGADDATTAHWCSSGSAVWNNSGDTVFVLDPSGNVVVSHSY